ncbi:hypothetical protein [Alteromonas sp. RKMC-009]|uniref:hypothetical protein n=1 Tax=Alteromonas sp. RKMC-009 TaxID=2267264 RepID=UPI000E696677|nr:hypothetical protein [Alteromonas sp. RKMC-009]AYA65470.1 hypothetical protein DS731_16360 [Alteromonas sp. RKMC-009]
MTWSIENDFDLEEYIVESRQILGRHERIEYRLVRKTKSRANDIARCNKDPRGGHRRIISIHQLLSLRDYLSGQLNKLPLFEIGNESELEELERYEKLYSAAEDYFRIYKNKINKSVQLDFEEVSEWVYAWSEYLEILYEKNNSKLRKRFLKNEKYKIKKRVDKRKLSRESNLSISKQHEKSLSPPKLEYYAFEDNKLKNPFHQFKALEKEYSKRHPKFIFKYLREYKTLYIKPKLKNSVEFTFDDLRIVDKYFSKPRVFNNLSHTEKKLLNTHLKLAEVVINKQQKGIVDFELLQTWPEFR